MAPCLLQLAVLTLLATLWWPVSASATEAAASPDLAHAISLSYQRHGLSASDEPIERVSRLVYRGGLHLASPDRRFGGWSGLLVSPDGRRLLALSDKAHWLRADLTYDARGNLAGVQQAELAEMRDLDGKTMSKARGDAEGLAALSDVGPDGPMLTSFERQPRVWRYETGRSLDSLPQPVAMPEAISRDDDNLGLESLTLVDAHRLLAVMEAPRDGRQEMDAWLQCYPSPDACDAPGPLTLSFHSPFHISDAAMGPDGTRLYLLERRYLGPLKGVVIALREIAAASLRPGARLEGEEIARFDARTAMDNMEGLALRRGSDGKTYVYMISDDNYDPVMQRTLLLMLELEPAAASDRGAPRQ